MAQFTFKGNASSYAFLTLRWGRCGLRRDLLRQP